MGDRAAAPAWKGVDGVNNNALIKKDETAAVVTGDEIMDDMLSQTMKSLESDRKEADELYEMVRNNAEQTPDDPGMAHSAVQALKLKQNVTAQATRVMDIAARYKMQREKMLMQANPDDRDGELLEMLDEEEKPNEDKIKVEHDAKPVDTSKHDLKSARSPEGDLI